MPARVRMPPLGQTSDEITVTKWLKAPGDDVREGEPLLEVETDKALLEIEAASSGVLLAIVRDAGAVVTAGEVIGWIGAAGEDIPADVEPEPAALEPRRVAPAATPSAPLVASGRALATPGVRALARELGLDLEQIAGSGSDGRVERSDVLAALGASDGNERVN